MFRSLLLEYVYRSNELTKKGSTFSATDYGVAPVRFTGHTEVNQQLTVYRVILPYEAEWYLCDYQPVC